MTTIDLAQARADAQAALSATVRLCDDDVTARMSAANIRYCRSDVPTLAAHIEALAERLTALEAIASRIAHDATPSGHHRGEANTNARRLMWVEEPDIEALRAALGWTAGFTAARGCAPARDGAELPEVAIRRQRDGQTGVNNGTV